MDCGGDVWSFYMGVCDECFKIAWEAFVKTFSDVLGPE